MRQILRLLVIPLLFGFAAPALAQGPLVISGRVTDQAGAPIPGAQIVIEGTTIGTVAGDNGEYRLVVGAPRAGMVLLVRSISYKPVRQTLSQLSGSLTQDFRLATDVLRLSEVVVTSSRGETERSTLGTTIATVQGDELAKANTTQLDAALQGKIAGALISRTRARPAAEPASEFADCPPSAAAPSRSTSSTA
jgi:hypothetical protein